MEENKSVNALLFDIVDNVEGIRINCKCKSKFINDWLDEILNDVAIIKEILGVE